MIECKTSVADFYADKKKSLAFEHPSGAWTLPARRIGIREAERNGYKQISLPRMGDYRFYMSEPDVLSAELIIKHAPDHGLLHVVGRKVKIVLDAPKRWVVDNKAEIRYLRFSIINRVWHEARSARER